MAPFPPTELMNRVGYLGDGPGVEERYDAAGARLFALVEEWLGDEIDLDDATVLDLGCGAGRVLRHWAGRAARGAHVVGVDIDEPSVAWCREHLGEVGAVHLGTSAPPLNLDDGAFDALYAFSLFTHLDERWAEWLGEVHRLLRPGGLALVTFLDPAQMVPILGVEPDGREGMVSWGAGRNWDVGGPVVFHAPWWIEEHWGRAFDIVRIDDSPTGSAALGTQSAVLLRARARCPDTAALRRVDPELARDVDALRRADEIRDVAGPRAFDADHRLAGAARAAIIAGDPNLAGTGLDICAHDDMYLSHLAQASSAREAITSYFAVGLEVLSVLDRVVEWHFGDWRAVPSLLDVGSGYGRVTRFVVHRMSAAVVTVADIQPGAVHFQTQTFGVQPIVTQADAITVPDGTRYGLVTAVSLFTHLPRHRFVPWLRQLWRLVDPGGVLVFSTHHADPPPRGVTLDADGLAYIEANEIPALDVADYGTTYTSDAYVRNAIAAACVGDEPAVIERIPRAFGTIQDVYVLGRTPAGTLTGGAREPVWGNVDRAELRGDTLVVEGWAADPTGTRAGAAIIRASVDGEPVTVRTGLKRPDVAAYFHRPWDLDLLFSGWQIDVPTRRDARLVVEVHATAGTAVIHDGPLPRD